MSRGLILVWALVVAGGCATVAPYERERLADRAMELDADPLWSEMEQHTHDYREGAAGGLGGGGGGCGCN
jgi:hypothetical protein